MFPHDCWFLGGFLGCAEQAEVNKQRERLQQKRQSTRAAEGILKKLRLQRESEGCGTTGN